MWRYVEMDMLWRRCSVLCRMYEGGKDVVRKWLCQLGAIQGAEIVFSKSTLHLGVSPAVDFEREEELAEFESMYSQRSPLPLVATSRCCLAPPPGPCHPSAYLSAPHMFEACVYCADHLHGSWGWNSLTQCGLGPTLGRSVRAPAGVYPGCKCGVWVWVRMWGLEFKVIGCGYEVVRMWMWWGGRWGCSGMWWKEEEFAGRGVRWWYFCFNFVVMPPHS